MKLVPPPKTGAKILLFDIETSPILAHVWGLWENNVALNQIKTDWHLLSWSAKWLGDPESKIMYQDQRRAKNIEDDKNLLKDLWTLLDQCDLTITQNGASFDHKKVNARLALNNMRPYSPCEYIDTFRIAKKKFGFTSNKLEYLADKLGVKYKKSQHKKFPGFDLWKACLAGNPEAWKEMEEYNKADVLSLEGVYHRLRPWENSYNPNVFSDDLAITCACGNKRLQKNGFKFTKNSKSQRYLCTSCGSIFTGKKNLLSKEKRGSLLK